MDRTTLLLTSLLSLSLACGEEKSADDDDDTVETDTDTDGDTDIGADDDIDDDTDGDTDGDTDDDTDGDTDDDTDAAGVGPDDAWAAMGCEQVGAAAEPLVLGASTAESNTAVIVAADVGTWSLVMPASGDGWFTLEIPAWMTVMHAFTEQGVEMEFIDADPFTEALINGACPDAGISDQRLAFHEWGAYTVRVAEGAPETVWFAIAKEE